MKYCPSCGNRIDDPNSRFCISCGQDLRSGDTGSYSTESYDQYEDKRKQKPAKKRSKAGATIVVAIILIAGLGGLGIAAVGGITDFEVDYREKSFIFRNTSLGLFTGFSWSIEDEQGNELEIDDPTADEIVWEPPVYGIYMVTLTSTSHLGMENAVTREIVEDGTRSHTVKWTYDDNTYVVTYEMKVSDYYDYKKYSIPGVPSQAKRALGGYADTDLLTVFMTTDTDSNVFDSVILQLKEQMPDGLDTESKINFLMSFVQNLYGDGTYTNNADDAFGTYKSDMYLYGAKEYWAFPIETLYNKGGDCEDLAMLFMAICLDFFDSKAEVVDVAIAFFWENGDGDREKGHAMAAVSYGGVPTSEGSGDKSVNQKNLPEYKVDGNMYYVCETTGRGWNVGLIGPDYVDVHPGGETGDFVTVG